MWSELNLAAREIVGFVRPSRPGKAAVIVVRMRRWQMANASRNWIGRCIGKLSQHLAHGHSRALVLPQQLMNKICFLVGASGGSNTAEGIPVILGLNALELGCRMRDCLVPGNFPPWFVNGCTNHWLENRSE